jgi:ribosomal protein S27AE
MSTGVSVSELSSEQKRQVVEALEKAGAKLPCPRCANSNFTLLDGYFNQPVQATLGGLVLGGPSVPSAVVVCTRCGYLAQHALGVLGMLPKETGEEVKK